MKIVFATQNSNKVREVQALMPEGIELISLLDLGHTEDLEETSSTLEGNAKQKAEFVFNKYGVPCFADDTGLEIDALKGAPGVYSARYAGPQKDSLDNMKKVLEELKGEENRKAQFRTAISLFLKGEEHRFEGLVRGEIIETLMGDQGFGYDPIFIPEGEKRTFAQMTSTEKGVMSHRGRAIRSLVEWLHANID